MQKPHTQHSNKTMKRNGKFMTTKKKKAFYLPQKGSLAFLGFSTVSRVLFVQ